MGQIKSCRSRVQQRLTRRVCKERRSDALNVRRAKHQLVREEGREVHEVVKLGLKYRYIQS